MEAALTLKKKKTSISKGKVKKTIKNVLCRPDPVFWPNVSDEHASALETLLSKYKVEIPEFTKPHWKELKLIPKEQRPKPPKIKRVDGLLFGISECNTAVKKNECSSILIDSTVNPRTIMQSLIEKCQSNKVPVLCVKGLKSITSTNFGISTSCLAIKNLSLHDLQNKITEICHQHILPQQQQKINVKTTMDVAKNYENMSSIETKPIVCAYLYRTDKKIRVFNPSLEETKDKKSLIGQDFVQFSNKSKQNSKNKPYMHMVLKRIANNQNRAKRK